MSERAERAAIRTDRAGYVWDGKTLIGKVVRSDWCKGWTAYVQRTWNDLVMRNVGVFPTKREAIAEVTIERET